MPSKAIKSIKKTGEEISCCGKKLQAVELTFSDEKAVSYDDLFSTVKDVHTSVTASIAHSLHSLPAASEHPSFMSAPQTTGKEPVGGGGGVTPPIAFADSYGSCMVNAMLRGPSGHKAFRIWMDTWANICEALYG